MSNTNITNDATCSGVHDNDTSYVSNDKFEYYYKVYRDTISTGGNTDPTYDPISIGKAQSVDIISNVCQGNKQQCSEVARLLQPKVSDCFVVKDNILFSHETRTDDEQIPVQHPERVEHVRYIDMLNFRSGTWLDTFNVDLYMQITLSHLEYPKDNDPIITLCQECTSKSYTDEQKKNNQK